jgi:protein-S-isoprenylcysteine O-methyltransferase Ste14
MFKKTIIGLIQLIVGLGAMLFIPAGTVFYWQAWVYISIFGISIILISLYLYKNDKRLLKSRLNKTENEKGQQWIQFCIYISYIGIFILSSLDHRFLWSTVSIPYVILGDVLVAFGYLIILIVLRENTFASTTIEVSQDHKVISTGPYAIVRHPMYLGGIVMLLGTPLALGSCWGIIDFVLITFFLAWRLLEEEKFLSTSLSGYKEYCQKTRYHLIPYIW